VKGAAGPEGTGEVGCKTGNNKVLRKKRDSEPTLRKGVTGRQGICLVIGARRRKDQIERYGRHTSGYRQTFALKEPAIKASKRKDIEELVRTGGQKHHLRQGANRRGKNKVRAWK